ncbi:cupredoxin domain-containing protein [Nocardia mexicana]|uniref:Cupredoxin-like protein n=1 Tax=Nocardia mexicana TaxID=279262 RepID=A0A370HEX5_9NOCA|nr:cupredoxin domain-containing protein [Nocardia mexicana]RDI55773.1 cupredoxin-like protein [Nocardia mexicana]
MRTRLLRHAVIALAAAGLAVACTEKGGDDGSGAIAVTNTDDSCELSRTSAPVGAITFEVRNKGTRITEFYLYTPDGKVVSEVEGIGPGLSRSMTVQVTEPGTYSTACKPGMVGAGIRGQFTVTK